MAWDGDTHIKLASCYGCVVSWSPVWLEKEFSLRTELVTPKSLFHEMSSSYSVFSFEGTIAGTGLDYERKLGWTPSEQDLLQNGGSALENL